MSEEMNCRNLSSRVFSCGPVISPHYWKDGRRPGNPETGRNCISMVVSETSSSLRDTSIGPFIETRTFVWPDYQCPRKTQESEPAVQIAEPSARDSGFVAKLSERSIVLSLFHSQGPFVYSVVVEEKIATKFLMINQNANNVMTIHDKVAENQR